MKEWLSIAMRRECVVRGLKVGMIIGTILTAINYGDVILNRQIEPSAYWKIPLTYLVPFCVSTYAGVEAILAQKNQNSGN
jgi:hypothetical protein